MYTTTMHEKGVYFSYTLTSSPAQHLAAPSLYYPFPEEVNEHVAEVTQHTFEWFVAHDLAGGPVEYERFRDSHVGWLGARVAPYADYDELAITADWCMWLFAFDDHCDESDLGKDHNDLVRLAQRFMRIIERPTEPVPPGAGSLGRALRDLALRMSERSTSTWISRFARSVDLYLFALLWEATNRVSGGIPTIEDYVMMRPRHGAMPTVNDLIELAGRFELPADTLCAPAVRTLVSQSNNVVAWSNDILSFAKEARQGDVHNLVMVLQNQRGYSLEEAFEGAARMHDDEVRAFLDSEQRLRAGGALDPNLDRYILGLRHWMQGNWYWTLSNVRYASLRYAS